MRSQEWQHPTSAKRLKVLGGVSTTPQPSPNTRFVPFCMALSAPIHKFVKDESIPDNFELWYDDLSETEGEGKASQYKNKDDNILRAPLEEPLDDADLAKPSSETGFQVSDGILVDPDGQGAMHRFRTDERQAILSKDHIHVEHDCTSMTWTLNMKTAKWAFGDAYFGLTNASRFQCPGDTVGYDVAGTMIRGLTPQNVPIMQRTKLKSDLGTTRHSAIRITADLHRFKMRWEVYCDAPPIKPDAKPVGVIEYPICGWRSARLWISLRSVDDHVRLYSVETTTKKSDEAGPSHANNQA